MPKFNMQLFNLLLESKAVLMIFADQCEPHTHIGTPPVEECYNKIIHSITNYTPLEFMKGKSNNMTIDAYSKRFITGHVEQCRVYARTCYREQIDDRQH